MIHVKSVRRKRKIFLAIVSVIFGTSERTTTKNCSASFLRALPYTLFHICRSFFFFPFSLSSIHDITHCILSCYDYDLSFSFVYVISCILAVHVFLFFTYIYVCFSLVVYDQIVFSFLPLHFYIFFR
jgi:hypothetical protein